LKFNFKFKIQMQYFKPSLALPFFKREGREFRKGREGIPTERRKEGMGFKFLLP